MLNLIGLLGRRAICDNFSPHRHPTVRGWCAANQVELVFLPTYGSWLNWIEAEFAALRYFATVYRAIREDAFPAVKIRTRYIIPATAVHHMATEAATTGSCVDVAAIATRRRVERAIAQHPNH